MNLFICQTIAIGCGYILDLLIGDPHWLYHPVRLIGNLISLLESILLKEKDTSAKKYRKGMVLAILTPLITGIVTVSILVVGYHINMILGCVIETIMCYQILAVKSLKVESMKVYYALDKEGLQQARNAVAMIVGRDTKQLDEHGVVRAAVETVAENTSDGVIAPLFYMMLFGAVGGFVYKVVNTMDSMIGYKNDKYLYFGRFAAKLDDVVNFIPAMLVGGIMVVKGQMTLGQQELHSLQKNVIQRIKQIHIIVYGMRGRYLKVTEKSTAVLMPPRQSQPVQEL